MIQFKTTRFGELEVSEESLIYFPEGLPGMRNQKRFVLLDYKDTDIKWLQSVDSPEIAFIVIDPFSIEPQYSVELPDPMRKLIRLERPEDVAVLVILRKEGDSIIANLQGPLVINTSNRTGVQLVLDSPEPRVYNKTP
jgi:flagellar assembly factor FliW